MLNDNPDLLLEVLEQSPDAFACYDAEHRLQYCNSAFVAWFFPGLTAEDLAGRPISEVVDICHGCGQIAACNGQPDWREERLRSHRETGRPYEYLLVDGRVIQGREQTLSSGGTLTVLTDITERAQLVEARADSEQRYRELFENAAVGLYRSTLEGRFLEVNPAMAGIAGCDTPSDFLEHFHASRHFYVDPATRGEILALLDHEGVTRDFETRIYRADGTAIWITETARTVRDERGNILGYEGFITDITARRRAEAERDLSEARFRDFAELSADWFWETDLDQRFTWQQGPTPPLEGTPVPHSKIFGKTRWELLSEIGANPSVADVVADKMSHGESFWDLSYRFPHPEKGETWVRFSGKPVYDSAGRLVAYRGVGSDITEEKQAEAARQRVDTRLRHATQMAAVAHWVWDEESGRCIDCSENLEHFSGLPREQFIGLTHGEIQPHIHPDDWEDYHRVVSAFYAGGERFETVFRALTPDGQVRWCREIAERIPGPDGRLTHSIGTLQDITADRQLQNELRKAKELLQSQFDSSPLAIVTMDDNSCITSWNPAAEAIFGWTAEEVVGKPSPQIPPEREQERARLRETVGRGEHVRGFETLRRHKDGHEINVSINAAPLTSESGKFCGAVYVVADITEKKRIEATRAQVDARLDHATQMSKIAHWVWDERTGRCIDCSESMEHFTGVPKEDYIGLSQEDIEPVVHPDDWAAYSRTIKRFDETGERYEVVYRTIPEEGVVRWVREIGERIPAPDGSMSLSIGTAQDITEDRRLQGELREAKEQLQSQLNSSPLGIVTLDTEACIQSWNPAAEAIFGWTAEEVIGKPSPMIPGEREHERGEMRQAVHRGEGFQDYTTVRRRKDGREIEVSVSAAPLTAESGEIRGAVCLIADITERRRLEAELRKQEALALHAQKLEAVATLASGLAHDFNNMLLPIMIAAENLTEALPDDHVCRRDAEQILHTAERVAELVRRLLDFSRAEEPKRRRLAMRDAVTQALPLVEATLPGALKLETRLTEDCSEVEIDTGQLLQVLLNLVGNAADAQQQRGVMRLSLDIVELGPEEAAHVGAAEPGSFARLTLSDEGSGIPEETLPNIFNPFFTTKEVGKGTGLGLAVIHGIVTAHGGGIEVQSVVGQGTTFSIYFPSNNPQNVQRTLPETETTAA